MSDSNITKRSNRIYPEIKCKHCKKSFSPHDSRQQYCTRQHRIDAGNDRRKLEDQTRFLNQKKLRKIDRILEVVGDRMKQLKVKTITLRELLLHGIEGLNILVERSQAENNSLIQWYFEYGLQIANKEATEFIIVKR